MSHSTSFSPHPVQKVSVVDTSLGLSTGQIVQTSFSGFVGVEPQTVFDPQQNLIVTLDRRALELFNVTSNGVTHEDINLTSSCIDSFDPGNNDIFCWWANSSGWYTSVINPLTGEIIGNLAISSCSGDGAYGYLSNGVYTYDNADNDMYVVLNGECGEGPGLSYLLAISG